MTASARQAGVPAVDFARATSLALEQDFSGRQPQHFGAPVATSTAFQVGTFEGAVSRGASCNCSRISLVPHCNGTHTESASHLTVAQRPLHAIVPAGPMPAVLVTVAPEPAAHTGEDSLPAPRAGDRLICRGALRAALTGLTVLQPQALLLRTGTHWQDTAPPYLSRQLAQALVELGIRHLVTDLPSVDRLEDDGLLTAHRIFFGLPAGSTDLEQASRPDATITELASFPAVLRDGPCAVQIQIPAWHGDAVPSRPLHLPLQPA